jgi:hypothetical protein
MFEGENEDREQGRGKAAGHMLAIATLGITGSEVWVGGRHLGVGVTGLPRDEDQGTGSGNEENGVWEQGERGLRTRRTRSGNEVRNKPVIEVAQTITVPGCSMGSGIIFVGLRGTRILIEEDFRFYIQTEVERVNGGWLLPSVPVVPSECANMAPSECTSMAPSECTSMAPSECANIAPSTRMSTVT